MFVMNCIIERMNMNLLFSYELSGANGDALFQTYLDCIYTDCGTEGEHFVVLPVFVFTL